MTDDKLTKEASTDGFIVQSFDEYVRLSEELRLKNIERQHQKKMSRESYFTLPMFIAFSVSVVMFYVYIRYLIIMINSYAN